MYTCSFFVKVPRGSLPVPGMLVEIVSRESGLKAQEPKN
jgi:hypothetical protein